MNNYYVSKLVYGSEEPRWMISDKRNPKFVAEVADEKAAKILAKKLNQEDK